MCFVWIWAQTAIISLYSVNWLVFITETESVYCAVRTGSLCIILAYSSRPCHGSCVLSPASHRRDQVAIQASPGDGWWTKRHWEKFLSQYFSFPCQYHSTIAPYSFIHLPPTLYNVSLPLLQFSPVSIIPPLLHTHSFHVSLYHQHSITLTVDSTVT